MQLKIEKNIDSLTIKNGEKLIETYKMSEAIDFKGLMNELIRLELKEKIDFECDSTNFNEQEKTLYALLCEIKDHYNQNVDEYNSFKDNFNKS